jgi:glycosyltransferase involved in cell wall biosynthesis
MKRHLVRLGAPASHVHFIPYGIDERFFSPLPGVEPEIGFVVSVGETRSRDYAALFSAIEPLPVNLLVVPSGRWYAREKHNRLDGNVPGNVVISRGLSQVELRVLYARAQFAVVPVHDVVYSAGATAVLEAMSMGRAVIVTRSAGILDYVVDGETGIIVDPGDVAMMRDAIHHLAAHPQDARRMGENARQRVVEELNLNEYVQGLAALLTPFL